MATKIVTKNSSTASAVPTASDLVQGELAVNVADKKLFTEDNSGAIIELADGVKLAGIEASADVTDTANVTAAGAVMDSELTSEASVKALNQGVATTDSPAFAGLTVDTTTLAVDSTNNRVGIGTASPATALDTNGIVRAESAYSLSYSGVAGATSSFGAGTISADANWGMFFKSTTGASVAEFAWANAAGSERMRINSSGQVGIGTSSPSAKLNIDHSGFNANSTTSSSALKVQGSYGGGITISDTAESGFYADTSGTNFNMYVGKTGSDTPASKLVLTANSSGKVGIGTSSPSEKLQVEGTVSATGMKIGANGTDINSTFLGANSLMAFKCNGTERMRIDGSGNLLVGSTSAAGKLTVYAGSGVGQLIQVYQISATLMQFKNSQNIGGSITIGAGGGTSYNTSSDQRLKENIADADDAGSKIDAIQVRKYDWKADGSHQDYGMIAQELQAVAPEAVSGDADSEEMMGVDYSKLVPMLIKEIQSLRNRVAQLEE